MTKKELDERLLDIEKLKDQQINQQKLLLTQSKVAAVGEMLGNIAHQWRQPLSIISTNVTAMELYIDFDREISKDKIQQCAKSVMDQTEYLSKTIDDFRNFYQSDSQTKKEHKIKDIFIKLEELVGSSFKDNYIDCIMNVDDNSSLKINDNILIQSLINICNNSKDVMVERIKETDLRYFFVDVKKDNDSVVIILKDSGGGIKEDIMDKIFEPYFTTKHPSIGTGIGLYMTNQIITKHLKGKIEASNVHYEYKGKKLKGAQFDITIPIDKEES